MRDLGSHRLGGFVVSVLALSEEPGEEQYIAYASRPDEDRFVGRRGASREAVLLAIAYDVGCIETESSQAPQASAPRVVASTNMSPMEPTTITDKKCAHCSHRRSQHTGKGPRGDLFHGCSVWTCDCPNFGDPTPLSEVVM